MTKTELESKHLAELHSLAADAGVPRYRMLPRAELIEKLLDEKPQPRPRGERPKPERRRRPERAAPPAERVAPGSQPAAAPPTPVREAPSVAPSRPKQRRRRLWGRRGRKGVRIQDLLLPAAPGRQAIVYAESRERCTALLRELAAAELSGSGRGPDPIALLIDPSPEELAEWRREAPRAEIIAAGQARHAEDAVAQAARRAEGGEAVILLIDSLSRFTEAYGDPDAARGLFDAGRGPARSAGGSLTVVAAVERNS